MDGLPLHVYDIVMLAVLLLTTVFGAWKGVAWQLASLSSVVISCMVAVRGGAPLAPYFGQQAPWNRFIAMLVLYVATSLGIWLVFRLVAGIIDRVQLREFDRQIGALFGLAKGVLFCLVITFFAVTLSEVARQAILQSRSGYYMALLIQRANPVMPEEIRNTLGSYIDELHQKLTPTTASQEASGAMDASASQAAAEQGQDSPPGTAGQGSVFDSLDWPDSWDASEAENGTQNRSSGDAARCDPWATTPPSETPTPGDSLWSSPWPDSSSRKPAPEPSSTPWEPQPFVPDASQSGTAGRDLKTPYF